MIYDINGFFNTGDEWKEVARNKDELKRIIEELNENGAVYSYKVTYRNNPRKSFDFDNLYK